MENTLEIGKWTYVYTEEEEISFSIIYILNRKESKVFIESQLVLIGNGIESCLAFRLEMGKLGIQKVMEKDKFPILKLYM